MGVDLEEDLKRKMIELNIAAARQAQSPQTGYVHLNYDTDLRHDTIPMLENFCFVLALMRSRLAENIFDSKALLEKLLVFECDGNFPVYLHEFPQCKDRSFSLELLPVFHWILHDFRSALGEPLAHRIEMLIGRIISHGYKMHTQRPLSKSAEFRLKSYFEPQVASIPHSATNLDLSPRESCHDTTIVDGSILECTRSLWYTCMPNSADEWAEALISYQMAQSRGLDLSPILEGALQKWHPQLCVFIGPQSFDRAEPKVTLFDLFMGNYHSLYSRRALDDRRIHLLSSLIQSFDVPRSSSAPVDSICHAISPQSYSLYWGSQHQLNSLMFDPQKADCAIEKTADGIEFTIALPCRTFQEGEEVLETGIFFSLQPHHQIQINGGKATTFQFGDEIALISGDRMFKFEFCLEQGQGRFFGHICRANRPSQKGKNLKYDTFDWQIALRTIRRSEECRLKLKLTV